MHIFIKDIKSNNAILTVNARITHIFLRVEILQGFSPGFQGEFTGTRYTSPALCGVKMGMQVEEGWWYTGIFPEYFDSLRAAGAVLQPFT